MKVFSFYHKDTGEIHRKLVTLNVPESEMIAAASANAPPDHVPIEGEHDGDVSVVDVVKKSAVRRAVERVYKVPESVRQQRIRMKISELEARQHRRVREILAKDDERLSATDAEIQALRSELTG